MSEASILLDVMVYSELYMLAFYLLLLHDHIMKLAGYSNRYSYTSLYYIVSINMCSGVVGKCIVVVLVLILSLVEVHSQTVPYVSFMGVNLSNHAYVDLTTVGENISDPGNIVRCHTDLTSCCSGPQGIHRGSWFSLMILNCNLLVLVMIL